MNCKRTMIFFKTVLVIATFLAGLIVGTILQNVVCTVEELPSLGTEYE
jgi:hypothetical protein